MLHPLPALPPPPLPLLAPCFPTHLASPGSEQFDQYRREMEDELSRMRDAHAAEIARLRSEHSTVVEALRTAKGQLEADVATLQRDLASRTRDVAAESEKVSGLLPAASCSASVTPRVYTHHCITILTWTPRVMSRPRGLAAGASAATTGGRGVGKRQGPARDYSRPAAVGPHRCPGERLRGRCILRRVHRRGPTPSRASSSGTRGCTGVCCLLFLPPDT